MYDDGTPAGALPAPTLVIPKGPTNPHTVAYYKLDSDKLTGLRAKLAANLAPPTAPDGSPGYNAQLQFNRETASGIFSDCAVGLWSDAIAEDGTHFHDGNACLRLSGGLSTTDETIRLFNYSPPDPAILNPLFDSRVIEVGSLGAVPADPFRRIATLAPYATKPQNLLIGPSIDVLADFMPSLVPLTPAPNAKINLRLRPEEISFGVPAGARRPGLYMPIDLDFAGGVWSRSHQCIDLGDTSSTCPEIRANLDLPTLGSCDGANFSVRLNSIRVYLGLIPSARPGCVDPVGKSTSDETASGWMKNLPFTEPYRQGCLQLDVDVRVDTSQIEIASSSERVAAATSPIALWAHPTHCTGDVNLVCALPGVDCDGEAGEQARAQIRQRLQALVAPVVAQAVAPLLTSDGSAFGAGRPASCNVNHTATYSPSDSPSQRAAKDAAAAAANAKCIDRLRNELVSGSLARIAFGFFANAFRGLPIVDVQPCRPGDKVDGPSNPWDACCPMGTYAHMDGLCGALKPPTAESVCLNYSQDENGTLHPPPPNCYGKDPSVPNGSAQTYGPFDTTYFKVWQDADEDGVPGHEDTCPFLPSAAPGANADSDGDGYGYACDVCPCSGTETYRDADGDGVCEKACAGEVADNCPFVRNPDQKNVNREAETYSVQGPIQTAALAYGDACEPVPTPDFSISSAPYEVQSAPCRPVGTSWEICYSPQKNERVAFLPQGSHPTGDAGNQAAAPELAVSGLETRAYFCVPGPGRPCTPKLVAGNDNLAVLASETDANAVYRFANFRASSGGPLSSRLPDGPYASMGSSPKNLLWDVVGDIERWRKRGWGAGLKPAAEVGISPVVPEGLLWLRAAGGAPLPGYETATQGIPWGDGTRQIVDLVGVHRLAGAYDGPPAGAQRDLASVYWSGWPVSARPEFSATRFVSAPEAFGIPPCIECAQPQLEELDNCLVCGLGRRPLDGHALTVPVLVDPTVGLVLGADRDGKYRDIRAAISPSALQALARPHRLVSATDAFPLRGAAGRRPLAILLDPPGTEVVERLYGGGLGLGTQRDLIATEVGETAGRSQSMPRVALAATSSASVATYNRATGRLFTIRGRDARAQAAVWVYRVDDSRWQELALQGSVRVDRPLAAVYLPQSGSLWMLDETGTGFLRTARLLRIDAESGDTVLVSAFPRVGLYDGHYLLEDRDGRLLLAASSKLLDHHLLTSLSNSGRANGFVLTPGALAAPPMVDGEAYTFFLRNPRGAPRVRSLADLPMRPGSHPEFSRCF